MRGACLLVAVFVAACLLSGCSRGEPRDVTSPEPREDRGAGTRILLFGDSITQGTAGDWTWRYRLWQQLQDAGERDVDLVGPDQLLRDGSAEYADPGFDRDHASLWGAPLTPPAYDPEVLGGTYSPDVVVIELGTNDLAVQGATPSEVQGAMRRTVEEFRTAAPGVDVVLVHLPVLAVPGAQELNSRYDALARELDSDEERVVVAAADDGFVADPGAPRSDTYDGLHPDKSGEVKIAAAVGEALAELGIGTTG